MTHDTHDNGGSIRLRFNSIADFWAFIDTINRRGPPAETERLVNLGNEIFAPAGLETRVNPETNQIELHEKGVVDDAPSAPSGSGPDSAEAEGTAGTTTNLGPAVTTDPAQRERMREAAAEAREKVAALAQQPKDAPAEKPVVKSVAAPPKKRGRPPGAKAQAVTTEDQSGDAETGDRVPDEANLAEPTDYDAQPAPAPVVAAKPVPVNGAGESAPPTTPVARQRAIIEALRVVHEHHDRASVDAIPGTFGVDKLSKIPEAQLPALWRITEGLCAQHKVPFPPDGMTAP